MKKVSSNIYVLPTLKGGSQNIIFASVNSVEKGSEEKHIIQDGITENQLLVVLLSRIQDRLTNDEATKKDFLFVTFLTEFLEINEEQAAYILDLQTLNNLDSSAVVEDSIL